MKRETIERIIREEMEFTSNFTAVIRWNELVRRPYPSAKLELWISFPVSEETATNELRKTIRRCIGDAREELMKALSDAEASD